MNTPKEIGEVVRELRGKMSLRDFAKLCNISHTTIDNIEKGIDFRTGKPTQVKMATLEKIAVACGVNISYIIGEPDTRQIARSSGITDEKNAPTDVITIHTDLSEVERRLLAAQNKKPADEGELREDVVIYHRDGKTVKRTFTKEQLALFHAMLDAIPEDPGDNKGL